MLPAAVATSADAFGAIASRYDTLFSPEVNPLIAIMRERFYRAVARYFPVGSALLEIGCGTGEDTLALTARGYRLAASDPSSDMLAQAKAKLAAAGPPAMSRVVAFVNHGASDLAAAWDTLGISVDGVFSNMAPLNCELSLAPLRALLERALRPGGRFVGVVLPRFCPLEVALFLGERDPRSALRRFARSPVGDVEDARFPIRYYGAADFDRALGAGFRRLKIRSLGLALPPLAFGPALARMPRLLAALTMVEDTLSAVPGLCRMGDQILLAYERV